MSPGIGPLPLCQIKFCCILVHGETRLRHDAAPVLCNQLSHRKALARIVDRRLKQVGKGEFAESLVKRIPSGDSAWHCYRMYAHHWHGELVLGLKELYRHAGGRPAARV